MYSPLKHCMKTIRFGKSILGDKTTHIQTTHKELRSEPLVTILCHCMYLYIIGIRGQKSFMHKRCEQTGILFYAPIHLYECIYARFPPSHSSGQIINTPNVRLSNITTPRHHPSSKQHATSFSYSSSKHSCRRFRNAYTARDPFRTVLPTRF